MRKVVCQELLTNRLNDWPHLCQPVVPLLSTWNDGVIVGEVKILLDLKETLSWYSRSYWEVVEGVIGGPVVIQVRQPVHRH